MSSSFINKSNKKINVLYTVIVSLLLCSIFLGLVTILYEETKEEAYENLHVQTKQIKDDITLQILSDRENLSTMASFASKLYRDGEDYHIMFEAFKPIGLIENIGILNPDNVFVTKTGSMDLSGRISFEEEAAKGAYISGRVSDLTREGKELVRSAVPITSDGKIVGILYGVITLERIEAKYHSMADELDAQLFVYGLDTGDLIIDTVHDELGNISFLADRRYLEGYTYEDIMTTDKGYSSFESVYRDENVHMHYSTIEDLGWMIAMVRYDSQVFESLYSMVRTLFLVFAAMVAVIIIYMTALMRHERRTSAVTSCASEVRKILLETEGSRDHISDALGQVCHFTNSRSAVFFDTDGEDYHYIANETPHTLRLDAKKRFMSELLRYTAEYVNDSGSAIRVIRLTADEHLCKLNPTFYNLLKEHAIRDVIFSATVNNANHVSVLGVINAKRVLAAQMLAEKVSACFSMALSNKNQLTRTRLAAMTDPLTGVFNRVAYMNDVAAYNDERPYNFSCIYIDVNELHIRNNKYGHAAGDEMLLYVANSLKKVFFGSKIYRMGGDEFLVFSQNSEQEDIKKGIEIFLEQLKVHDYHVAVGHSYRTQNTNTDDMVREAEIRMYETKAKYYQNKEQQIAPSSSEKEFIQAKTGIIEIDAMLSILKENYNGIYRVSLDTDRAKRVLMPAYLNYNETEDNFSRLFSKYVSDTVVADYHRSLLNFKNYDAIRQQLLDGKTPKITYKKLDGETVTLSVYKLGDDEDYASDTLWIFAKKH